MRYIRVKAAIIFAAIAFAISRLLAIRRRTTDHIAVFQLGADVMPAWFREAIESGDVVDAGEWCQEANAVLIRSASGWFRADIGDWIGKRADGAICVYRTAVSENASQAA